MVAITPGQKASISPEAAEYLTKIPMIPFAGILSPYLASGRRVKNIRDETAAKMSPGEEDLIKRHKLKLTETTIGGVPVFIIERPVLDKKFDGRILLNFYGGGFIMGSSKDRAALLMAAEMGIRVYSVEYSKSPEVRYPVARNEALTVYRQLVSDFGAENIYGMGSSAGAQILVSLLLVAKKEGTPMPARLFLCTPALDLSGAGDSLASNEGRDLMPASLLSAFVKQNYMPDDIDPLDPLYSPIYATYDTTFPPTVITVGTRDLCLSNGVRMFWKLREAGVRVELFVYEGMWHGFNWNETIPEAIQCRKSVRHFLSEDLA